MSDWPPIAGTAPGGVEPGAKRIVAATPARAKARTRARTRREASWVGRSVVVIRASRRTNDTGPRTFRSPAPTAGSAADEAHLDLVETLGLRGAQLRVAVVARAPHARDARRDLLV